jgi:chromosome segregation ATPase
VARIGELESERVALSQKEATAKKQGSHIAAQQKSYHRKPSRSAVLTQEAAQNDEAINQDQEQIKELDKQLQELRGKLAAYPNPNSYLVDCLALDTGQDHNGMPIFDHGMVFR